MTLEDRITNYLANGGLFNPEMMEHEKVRDLLMDCRAVLASTKSAPEPPFDPAAVAEAVFANWHCESEGCAVEGYTKRAAEWADKYNDWKRRAENAEAALKAKSAAKSAEPVAPGVCYGNCAKHAGMPFTFWATAIAAPARQVCPICEPPSDQPQATEEGAT
jgi:hypothetical protein